MKLDILMVSIRELSKSFPEWYVHGIFTDKTVDGNNTRIVLEDQNYGKIIARLDSDGRLINRESLVKQRQCTLNN